MAESWWNYAGWPNFPEAGKELQNFWNWFQDDNSGDWWNALGGFGKNQGGDTPPSQPQDQEGEDPLALADRQARLSRAQQAAERLASGRGGSGGGGGGGGGPTGYYTPDGVLVQPGSPEDRYYQMADALWTKIYGVHAPFSVVQTFHDLGVENTSQLETVMEQMPSHIKNPDGSRISIGQYDQIKGTGNNFSDKYFGRPVPDSLIQDWVSKGISTPESVELWFLNHPAKDIPKDVYGQIFDEAAGWTQKYHNDLPHPDNVHSIYQRMQQT